MKKNAHYFMAYDIKKLSTPSVISREYSYNNTYKNTHHVLYTSDDLLASSSNEDTTTTLALMPSGGVPTLPPSPNIAKFLTLGLTSQADSLRLKTAIVKILFVE